MFAATLAIERDPLQSLDLLTGFPHWVRVAGGLCSLVLCLVALYLFLAGRPGQRRGLVPYLLVFGGLILAPVVAILLAPAEKVAYTTADNVWHVISVVAGLIFLGIVFLTLAREITAAEWLNEIVEVGLGRVGGKLYFRFFEFRLKWLFVFGLGGVVLFYGTYFLSFAPYWYRFTVKYVTGETYKPPFLSDQFFALQMTWLTLGGACSLIAVFIMFFVGVVACTWRRIWAIARLTSLEVFRSRILILFGVVMLVFMFAPWFVPLASNRPQAQVYDWTQLFYFVIFGLLGLTMSLLASFGIHNDIKSQNIHTILTKPVQRYEVVLGRFLGYTLMMTLALAVLTSLSLVFLLRGVSPTAQEQFLKARVPVWGNLEFEKRDSSGRVVEDIGFQAKGENVGEEWEYRGYISGPQSGMPTQYAIWRMTNLPSSLADRERGVPCEFTFSIYRTTTGDIAGGVKCAIEVQTWRWNPTPKRKAEYADRVKTLASPVLTPSEKALPRDEQDKILKQRWAPWNRLATIYGYFSVPALRVTNGETQVIELPAGLFRNQQAGRKQAEALLEETVKDIAAKEAELKAAGGAGGAKLKDEIDGLKKDASVLDHELGNVRDEFGRPIDAVAFEEPHEPLSIMVECTDRTQFVGMAKYDLYLLDHEQPFWLNFYKGVSGIWLFNVMVIALGCCFSTILNGVVSWLVVLFYVGLGWGRDHLEKLAMGINEGGGPGEAWLKLIKGAMPSAELEDNAAKKVAEAGDVVFRWFIRMVFDMFLDVSRLDFTYLVSTGFNVSVGSMLTTAAYQLGYLVFAGVLAYFLIRSREIAAST